MPSQATSVDAQLVLQLYDLRREAEMRKARSWFAATLSPSRALPHQRLRPSRPRRTRRGVTAPRTAPPCAPPLPCPCCASLLQAIAAE